LINEDYSLASITQLNHPSIESILAQHQSAINKNLCVFLSFSLARRKRMTNRNSSGVVFVSFHHDGVFQFLKNIFGEAKVGQRALGFRFRLQLEVVI
jgi:hypothetical protein